ncbi:MAG: DUF362 domain-containing protein [Bifidobacterium sp.]|uniref:DUF362 domain-containing protein n=1 Tax=Bifidobacterium sp. TaxID=41200 RepID=UPI003EFD7BD7
MGTSALKTGGYQISDQCDGCGKCLSVCPQDCIDLSLRSAVIDHNRCLHCGNCVTICPTGAVMKVTT